MSHTKFYFRPAAGEQIETTINLRGDIRSAVYGYIKSEGTALSDVAVLLFEMCEDCEPKLITMMFTDDAGQFVFGPLDAGKLYLVKVFGGTNRVRELELEV